MQFIPKWLVQTIAGAVAVLLIVVSVNQLLTLSEKSRAVDSQHIINITAQGKVTVKPDIAIVNISVTNDDISAEQAQKVNSESMNKATEFIKSQGIDEKDIQTSGYNIYQKYSYSNGQSYPAGYTATQNLTVKVRDLNKVSKIVDGAIKNGANQINGVNYTFADPDAFREQAREAALKNAREKATNLANAAGVHLGKLISFSESGAGTPVPMYFDKGMASGMGGGGAAPAPDLQPGVQDIVENISVSYEIY